MITPTQRCVLLMAAGAPPALLIGVFAPGLWYAGLVWIPAVLSLLLMDWLFAAWKPEVEVQAPGAVEITDDVLRRAMIYGSVMASFNVEKFGTERVDELDYPEINQRFRDFKRMTHFEDIPFERATTAA